MRHLPLIAILLGQLATVTSAADQGRQPFAPAAPNAIPMVVVPGGYKRQAPPNTSRAIAMAIEDELDAVELEVRRTSDGQHVIFDTERVDGKTSGTGAIKDLKLAELQALDAGSWFAPRFAGAKIMTLAECLALARGKIGLVLVCRDIEPEQLTREILAGAEAGQVAVIADRETALRVYTLREQRIVVVRRPGDADANAAGVIADKDQTDKPPVIALSAAADLTKDRCRELHNEHFTVAADACGPNDNEQTWDALLAAGVDLVRTNRPESFIAHAIARRTPQRRVQYAAHRGALRYAPENTTASLEAAERLHADFVEIDVHTTSDGAFFLLHDGTLDRTTNGKGRVRQAAAETLRGLDAGRWFGLPFAGAAVPELDSYLAKFPPKMGLYFDAKDITPEALAEAVARHGLVERTVVYQGPVYLEKLKAINPAIRTLAPVAAASHVDTLAKRFQPYAVDTSWKLLSAEYIAHCHELGIKVFSDAKGDTTINGYRQAIEWGIDLIQTDHPLRLWRAIDQAATK
jgi:glycerophosphoryl diester phosphodiesterase